jgi:hypothetical protein
MKPLYFILLTILLANCKDKETPAEEKPECERTLAVSDIKYQNATDNFNLLLQEVSISGNCMQIFYTYGGGCGEISTELVALEGNTLDPMGMDYRQIKLSIDDRDTCTAQVSKTEEFDISALRGEGDSVRIKLDKWRTDIFYTD